MSTTTINPSSTVSVGSATIVGAGSVHGALSDSSDSSYIVLGPTHTGVAFSAPSIPSGAIVQTIVAQTRVASVIPDQGGGGGGNDRPGSSLLRNNLTAIEGTQDFSVVNLSPLTSFTYVSTDKAENSSVGSWEFDLSDKTLGGGGGVIAELRVYRLSLLISYITRPTVTLSLPTQGGTVTNTSFPLTRWSITSDADGGPTNITQVKVFNDGQYTAGGFNPDTIDEFAGTVFAAGQADAPTEWRVATKLPNDVYRAYVRTVQFGYSNFSTYGTIGWTQNVVPPADPSSVATTVDNPNGRISIAVNGNDSPRNVDGVDIERSDDGGTTFNPIRSFADTDVGVGITPVSGTAVAFDWEMPAGTAVVYRARTLHSYSLGEIASSDWVNGTATTFSPASWYVKHPTDWSLNQTPLVHSQASYTRAARAQTFTPLGRSDAVVVSDVRQAPAGEIAFRLDTEAAKASFDELVAANDPVLIQAPASHGWAQRWVMLGDQTRERVTDAIARPHVFDSYPWTEVGRPDGTISDVPTGVGPSHLLLPFTLGTATTLH